MYVTGVIIITTLYRMKVIILCQDLTYIMKLELKHKWLSFIIAVLFPLQYTSAEQGQQETLNTLSLHTQEVNRMNEWLGARIFT